MRLYLSSYRLGNHVDRLLGIVDEPKHTAVVSNALDFIPDEERERYQRECYDPHAEFARFGVKSSDLDLRDFFGDRDDIEERLEEYNLVWVMGGNSFLLIRAMKLSGFDRAIKKRLDEDTIVYAGFSAGAVVASPNLRGIELMDDPNQSADEYPLQPVWDGLGLINFSIVPHFRSEHPEAPAAEKAFEYFSVRREPFKVLRDGEVVVRVGTSIAHLT